ncbi:hypothetical protein HK097_004289, partial [Rhizophlyctis rosea]
MATEHRGDETPKSGASTPRAKRTVTLIHAASSSTPSSPSPRKRKGRPDTEDNNDEANADVEEEIPQRNGTEPRRKRGRPPGGTSTPKSASPGTASPREGRSVRKSVRAAAQKIREALTVPIFEDGDLESGGEEDVGQDEDVVMQDLEVEVKEKDDEADEEIKVN